MEKNLDALIGGIALIVATPIVIITYLIKSKLKTKKEKFIDKARANGYYTVGKAVNYFTSDQDEEKITVFYEYFVDGVLYHKRVRFNNTKNIVTYPDNLTIYYNPRNPKRAICEREATLFVRKKKACLTSLCLFLLIIGVVVNFLHFLFNYIT